MAFVRKRSVLPIYLVGVTWLVWSLAAPLYRPTHYIMAALTSAVVYYLGKLILPDRGYEIPDSQSVPTTPQPQQSQAEDPQMKALREERDKAVSQLRRLNDAIADQSLSRQMEHLERTTVQILDAVADDLDKLPKIRRFVSYYLPTTLKLLDTYARMDATGAAGENIDRTKDRIAESMATICAAFDRQLDALYSQEALDISTDIDVLEQMLAREGLGPMQFDPQSTNQTTGGTRHE